MFSGKRGGGIEIVGHSTLQPETGPSILRVTFKIAGDLREAYAYGNLVPRDSSIDGAALMIPGSGHNQAWSIANSDSENYHCCMWDGLEGFAKFVLIKPNEDARAIHDGSGKLSPNFFVVDFLHRGGSYSASYIAEAAALTGFLKSEYGETAVLGLSQGGLAALVSSLLETPDALVVSSGYSSLWAEQVTNASPRNQILIPGLQDKLVFRYLAANVNTPTLFTWGREETGTPGIEARDGRTCRRIQYVDHFSCVIHPGGHTYPETEVRDFLETNLGGRE